MKTHFFEHKNAPSKDITPTIHYFLEKSLGNADLAMLEKKAIDYMKNKEPTNPADVYFFILTEPSGIASIPQMRERNLHNHKIKALDFVRTFTEQYCLEKSQDANELPLSEHPAHFL